MLYLITFAAAVVLGVCYWLSCKWWPYGPCLRCVGHPGKNRGSNSRRWGNCRRCRGSGKRVRLGARLMHTIKEGR
jgi:hypothetical protein